MELLNYLFIFFNLERLRWRLPQFADALLSAEG